MSSDSVFDFETWFESEDDRPEVMVLFRNLKKDLNCLSELLNECNNNWDIEDSIYRFYHQSHKVYGLQYRTRSIIDALESLLPGYKLNEWFLLIVQGGTGKEFERAHNEEWLKHTRPILEGFFHARYFLEVAVKYGNELEYPPNLLPGGWAAFLYLYDLR